MQIAIGYYIMRGIPCFIRRFVNVVLQGGYKAGFTVNKAPFPGVHKSVITD